MEQVIPKIPMSSKHGGFLQKQPGVDNKARIETISCGGLLQVLTMADVVYDVFYALETGGRAGGDPV